VKKYLVLLLVIGGVFLSGCHGWGITGIRGNGKVISDKREIANFTGIELNGAYSVYIEVGKSVNLTIKGEENILKYIRTKVEGNKLVIDTKKNISPRKEIQITITVPELEFLESSGACGVTVSNIASEKFLVDLSGAGSLDLSGKTGKLEIDLSGAGSLQAKDLKARKVVISLSGASSADVYASETLDASVSGVGSITYYGDPKDVKKDVSGIGVIKKN